MFHFQNLYVFFIASLLLNIAPGNDMMFVASRSISQGIKAGLVSCLGIFVGCFVHITAAVLGLSLIIAKSAYLFQLIKFAGAGYLIYLGVRALTSKTNLQTDAERPVEVNYQKLFKQSALTNILNPKVAIFFLSFLPLFIDPHSAFVKIQLFTLGVWFAAQGTTVLMIVACILGKTKDFFKNNPKVWAIQEKVTGFILIALGIKIAFATKT